MKRLEFINFTQNNKEYYLDLRWIGCDYLFKGIIAQKEDEIKKGQHVFIKRLIVAAMIFFVIVFGKFFISVVADSNRADIISCIDCFLSGTANCK